MFATGLYGVAMNVSGMPFATLPASETVCTDSGSDTLAERGREVQDR